MDITHGFPLCKYLFTRKHLFVNSVLLLSIFPKIFSNCYDSDFNSPKASLLCAVLFALHPIHTESVSKQID